MSNTIGGLVSFNNFLSTSKDRAVSNAFAESNQTIPDLVGILFVMKIDPSQTTTPFASIAGISNFGAEEEVLFSMHSVFRIQDITQIDGNNCLYEVNLVLTSDNDPELKTLTDYIRRESHPDDEGWFRLGSILRKMGQFKKAEDIYQLLLDQTNDDEDKEPIHGQLGSVKYTQGKYEEALTFYEKALTIKQSSLPPNHIDLAPSYNNIGLVHDKMGNYPKALSFHDKVLEIRQQSLRPSHPHLAMSYNNIGLVHCNMGNYRKALSAHEKALDIREESLPSIHPDLATSYHNIGEVYGSMGDYPKALLSHKKALEI
ncbi:unnamed protein product [Adineta steineri]|uniref:Kinesin light chain n=1 Tax=Adineta steineri TaxID=433720 RepID=A0A820HS27_9BILA|nr:unnamed protein product [Adineta steineri]